jgi:multicomponent Na+:H+ antiporter subunit F
VQYAAFAALALIALGGVGAAYRAWRGPSLPDRVVAMDLLATHLCACILIVLVLERQPFLLWVAMLVGLLLFLGTLAYARTIQREARP